MRVFKRLNILLIGLIAALPAIAQDDTPPEAAPTSKQFGDVTVHFTVLNTSFLSPQVARSYGIVRGDNKFLMNVAVSKQEEQRSRLPGMCNAQLLLNYGFVPPPKSRIPAPLCYYD